MRRSTHHRLSMAVGSALLLVAALPGRAAAELTGPPTPLDSRRIAALEAVDARFRLNGSAAEYPGPNYRMRQDAHEHYYQDKAAAIFALVDLGMAPRSRLVEANRLLRYELLGKWAMTSPGQVLGDSGIWMHRSRSLGVRLFMLYGHLMDADLVAEHEKRFGWMVREPFTSSSENIRTTNSSAFLLAHEIMGRTGEATYRANTDWMLAHLRRLATGGMHEWGGSYASWTFLAILNLAEFSQHEELRELATMFVDHFIARQLAQSHGAYFSSAKVRAYAHWSIGEWSSPNTRMSQVYFDPTAAASEHVWTDFVVSGYRPLTTHQSIFDDDRSFTGRSSDATGGGQSWRHYFQRGESFLTSVHQTPERAGYVLPTGGTHDIMNAVVLAGSGRNHIITPYAYDTRTAFRKKRNLNQRSFAYDNVVLVQNSGTTQAVWAGGGRAMGIPARLYFHDVFTAEIQSGWAFLRSGDTYVAWAPTIGDPQRDPEGAELLSVGNWLRSTHVPDDNGETVVMEVGERATFGSYAAFKAAILARGSRPRVVDGVVSYTARDGAVLRWLPNRVMVDGVRYDPTSHPRLDTPWVRDSTIVAGGSRIAFDFATTTTTGERRRLPSNIVFGRSPVDPEDPGPASYPAYGFIDGQMGNRVTGWAYDHESDPTELELIVVASPVHDAATVLGRITADGTAGAVRDMAIRDFVRERVGEEPPADHRFLWGGDVAAMLAGFGHEEPGEWRVQFRVVDQQDPAGGSVTLHRVADGVDTFTIVVGAIEPPVEPEGLIVDGASLPLAVEGLAYEAAVAASGGTPPYSFSLNSGDLPDGLMGEATGRIFGVPSVGTAGSHELDVRVTDADGVRADGLVLLEIAVEGTPPPLMDPPDMRDSPPSTSGGCGVAGGTQRNGVPALAFALLGLALARPRRR